MSAESTESIAEHLIDSAVCPRCDSALGAGSVCPTCRADLGGAPGVELYETSVRIARDLRRRAELIEALPTAAADYGWVSSGPELPAFPGAGIDLASVVPAAKPTAEGSTVGVSSVLSVLGSALVAVAALVFAFLGSTGTEASSRTLVLLVTTGVFALGALLLARARLRFSAEAVGALAILFVTLDIWTIASHAALPPLPVATVGTLVAAMLFLLGGLTIRLRTWTWAAVVAFALVPVLGGRAFASSIGSSSAGSLGVATGFALAAAVAVTGYAVLQRMRRRLDSALTTERTTAAILAFVSSGAALLTAFGASWFSFDATSGALTAVALGQGAIVGALGVVALAAARTHAPRVWSFVGGAFFVVAWLLIASVAPHQCGVWMLALVPVGAGAVTVGVAVGATTRWAAAVVVHPGYVSLGAWCLALASAVPAALVGAVQVLNGYYFESSLGIAAPLGVAGVALATALVYWRARRVGAARAGLPFLAGSLGVVAIWVGGVAASEAVRWSGLPALAQIAAAVILGSGLWVLLARRLRAPRVSASVRAPLVVGVHVSAVLALFASMNSPFFASWPSLIGGAAVVALLAAAGSTVTATVRPIHAVLAFSVALLTFAHGLSLATLPALTVLCLTTTLACAIGAGATVWHRIPFRLWVTFLVVAMIPFALGVVSVLFERSGWSALSTGSMFALAVIVMGTKRAGLSRWLRASAGSLLVPALAVVAVCLGAQVLSISASPIVLPVIAVVCAVALAGLAPVAAALRARGMSARDVRTIALAIEGSTLLTGALAVVLALVRDAAGLGTAVIVLLVLGVGSAATAAFGSRRYLWAVAAAALTGALWCFWGIVDVRLFEAFLLPPALGVALVGAVLVVRGQAGRALVAAGLGCAVIPSLLVYAFVQPSFGRAAWLIGFSIALIAFGLIAGRMRGTAIGASSGSGSGLASAIASGRLRSLALPALAASAIASSTGTITAVRSGLGIQPDLARSEWLLSLALTLGSTVLVTVAGAIVVRMDAPPQSRISQSRWVFVPALAWSAAGVAASVRANWASESITLAVELALLALMVGVTVRTTQPQTRAMCGLPPVPAVFTASWIVAVAAWSPRMLRLEAFSLPMGCALLAVGVLALRATRAGGGSTGTSEGARRRLRDWPHGFAGSWALLTPGLLATLIPSMVATGTDPVTIRAILVIGLALSAILLGSLRRLAAPFMLGIVVLPIENITVFTVQLTRSIGTTPWWITLATAGAVLLVIAATWERRAGRERGVTARIRDLG